MDRTEYLIRRADGNEKICFNCKHYHQHFVRNKQYNRGGQWIGTKFQEIDDGHCVGGKRFKQTKAWKTCEKWEVKDDDNRH